ncbi:fimbria/pilus outer membrane usher protein, partial [Vibrio rotiferianus]
IAVPNELSLTQQISLSDNNDHYNYIEPSFYSGYLNIFLNANETQSFDEQSSRTSLYSSRLDSGLNIGLLNIEYESIFENGSEKESTYNREGTRLNVDFPTQGTRRVVGDMYNPGTSFQDGTDVLGLGITRDFTLIPTRNVRPKANQSFTLQRTSSVDVVIDGIVVQRLTLGAGSYNLSDIPLAQGTNDVELVISDSSGQQERIQFSI